MPVDIHATLLVNEQEAHTGTVRTLTLENGHQVIVAIPANVFDGQELQYPGQAGLSNVGEQTGTLILTVRLAKAGLADGPPVTHDILLPPPPDGPPVQSAHNMLPPTPPQKRQKVTSTRIVILAVATIVLIGGSIGTLLAIATPQLNAQVSATNHRHATATAWSIAAEHADATSQALDVTATSQALAAQSNATATAVANGGPNPYIASMNTLDLFDPLDGTDNQNWSIGDGCSFANGALHIVDTDPKLVAGCMLPSYEIYTDFTLEVQYSILRGDTVAIAFHRAAGSAGDYTIFIDGQGNCYIDRHDKANEAPTRLFHILSAAVIEGYHQTNTLGLTMQGSAITLYINHTQVGTVNDTTYPSGRISLLSASYAGNTDPTEDTFNNLRIWK